MDCTCQICSQPREAHHNTKVQELYLDSGLFNTRKNALYHSGHMFKRTGVLCRLSINAPRTLDEIYLSFVKNMQWGHEVLDLATGHVILMDVWPRSQSLIQLLRLWKIWHTNKASSEGQYSQIILEPLSWIMIGLQECITMRNRKLQAWVNQIWIIILIEESHLMKKMMNNTRDSRDSAWTMIHRSNHSWYY